MTLYLALAPEAPVRLRGSGMRPAHVAYSLDAGGQLTRSTALAAGVRGGLMVLSGRSAAPESPEATVRAIVRECAARQYQGVVCDMDGAQERAMQPLWRTLDTALCAAFRRFYVPEGVDAPNAKVLLCTALSGGTLRDLLCEGVRRYGAQRCALDCQRLMMDFPLPCPSGIGRALTAEQLNALRRSGTPFFSSELGARYFTYRLRGETRFVLYDDAQTLRAKLRLGRELGISTAFFQYPEVCDLLPELFSGT